MFWKLWPKDFHRPYGQGLEPDGLEDEVFQKRLTSASCYWYQDPGKAVSTLVATLQESTALLKQMDFQNIDLNKHVNDLHQLGNDIAVLNVRGQFNGEWKDSLKRLQDFIDDVENQALFKYFAIFGANIWLPNLLLTTMVYIVNNLKEVKKKVSPFATEPLKQWCTEGDSKSVRRFLKMTVPEPKASSSSSTVANANMSFLQKLTPSKRDRRQCNDSSDSDGKSGRKLPKSGRRTASKRRQSESDTSDSESDSKSC